MTVTTEDTNQGPVSEATTEALAKALREVLPDGLPIGEETAGSLLLNLRSVYARAVIPGDRHSRLAALNELLPRLIATITDATFRDALQTLFGLAPGTRGALLTARRRQAAALLDYSLDHFRTRIEDNLVQAVAVAVHDDLLRYRSRIKRAEESLEPTGDTPRLGPESLTAEEELISRIWQHVYGMRAEVIAHLRLGEQQGYEAQAEDHRQAALRQQDELRGVLKEYVDTYGEGLVQHGDAEFSVAALERLAGWRY